MEEAESGEGGQQVLEGGHVAERDAGEVGDAQGLTTAVERFGVEVLDEAIVHGALDHLGTYITGRCEAESIVVPWQDVLRSSNLHRFQNTLNWKTH